MTYEDDGSDPKDVSLLLDRAAAGDGQSADELLAEVYGQLRKIAQRRMMNERPGHTLEATALVHEAYLRLLGSEAPGWSSRAHFYVAASRAMQRILIDHARRKNRLKRVGTRQPAISNVLDLANEESLGEALALDDALARLEEEDPRAALVIRLRFYAGLTVEETAKAIQISERTVMRDWVYARAWLRDALNPDESDPPVS